MEVEEDGRCFVCGPENQQGLKVRFTVDREGRGASALVRVGSQFQGWEGVVHGGILAALLDEASIYACRAVGERFVTAELKVRYRKPVAVDTELLVTARIVDQKRRVFSVTAQVEAAGEVLAEAEARVFAVG